MDTDGKERDQKRRRLRPELTRIAQIFTNFVVIRVIRVFRELDLSATCFELQELQEGKDEPLIFAHLR